MKRRNVTEHVRRQGGTYAGILVLFGGVLLFHWRGLAPGMVFLPVDLTHQLLPWRTGAGAPLQNWLLSDPLYQFYPFLIQTVDSLRGGDLLLWNPGIFSGHPALADPLFQTFYPFVTAFALLLGPPRGLSVSLVAHALLAALLMFGFLRSYHLRVPSAVLGGFTYALSGYMVTWFEFPFWITTLAWLPGILWAYHASVARQQWGLAALAGLLLGLAALAGQYQFLVVFTIFWGAYAAAQALAQRGRDGGIAHALLGFVLALGVGALIGALQALPFAELLAASRRVLGSGQEALPLSQLITLLLPHFYGSPALPEDYWGYGNYNEHTIYTGVVALYLAWLGLLARRRPWALFAAGAALAVTWFAVGGPGAARLAALPGLQGVAPHRVVFLLPLLVGWLAADTLDRPRLDWRTVVGGFSSLALFGVLAATFAWSERTAAAGELIPSSALATGSFLAAAAVLLLLREWRPGFGTACNWLIVALVWLNLLWFGRTYNPVGPIEQLFPPTPVTAYLRQDQGSRRTVPLQRGDALLFGPNAITDYGVRQPGGYSSLVIGAYHDLVSRGDPEIDSPWIDRSSNFVLFSHPSDRLLDLLNVNLLVSPEELFDPGPLAEIVAEECVGAGIAVDDARPLRGEFDVWRSAINRIDVPLVTAVGADKKEVVGRAAPNGEATLRVWRDGAGGTLAVEARAPLAELMQQPQWTVYFTPEADAPGRTYAWELSTTSTAGADRGLRVCADAEGRPSLSVYGPQLAAVELPPDNGVRLYERFTALPRASVVYAAETRPDAGMRLDRLFDPSFDVRNTALVETATALPTVPPRPATAARIVDYRNNRVVIEATALTAGLLVLSDQYFAGWQAAVDGQPAPILRVNHTMRGVPLSAGEHVVTFTFAPRSLQLGAVLAGLGLLLAVAVAVWDWRRRATP